MWTPSGNKINENSFEKVNIVSVQTFLVFYRVTKVLSRCEQFHTSRSLKSSKIKVIEISYENNPINC